MIANCGGLKLSDDFKIVDGIITTNDTTTVAMALDAPCGGILLDADIFEDFIINNQHVVGLKGIAPSDYVQANCSLLFDSMKFGVEPDGSLSINRGNGGVIIFDGIITNQYTMDAGGGMLFVKVSDDAFIIEQLLNSTVTVYDYRAIGMGAQDNFMIYSDDPRGLQAYNIGESEGFEWYAIGVDPQHDISPINYIPNDIIIPEYGLNISKGLYFMYGDNEYGKIYTASLEYSAP